MVIGMTEELTSKDVARMYRDYINPDLARVMRITGLGTVEDHAKGSYVWDITGKKYLDMAGGYGVFCVGHSHPHVIAAVEKQLHKMSLSAKVFFTEAQARLAKKLAEITPGDLQYTFFCNSGTEAVEGALKIARLATGRTTFVAMNNAFHGKSTGGLAVSGRPNYRDPFEPLMPEVRHIPFGDVKALEDAVDETVSAVIVEPVQGEGGIHVAPDGYMQRMREVCDQHGALLIADEVQTGFGRTGKMFAVNHWNVTPDILVLAKALSGGVLPIGAFVGTPRVWSAFKGRPTIHTSTFGGSPLACTAGLATLEVYEQEDLCRKSAESGAYFKAELEKLAAQYPDLIKEVRGLGLLLGLESVKEEYAGSIISEMSHRNIIAVYTLNQPKVIRFEPALAIAREDIDLCLKALAESLAKSRELFAGRA